jgi:hypothetical protein
MHQIQHREGQPADRRHAQPLAGRPIRRRPPHHGIIHQPGSGMQPKHEAWLSCCHARSTDSSEAFSPLPGRCFRMVAHHGEAGPIDRPESMAWCGSWRGSERPPLRVEACEGHRPPPLKVAERTSEKVLVLTR